MKKMISIFLTISMLISLAACAGSPSDMSGRSAPTADEEEVCGVPLAPEDEGEGEELPDAKPAALSFAADYAEVYAAISERLYSDDYRGGDVAVNDAVVDSPAEDSADSAEPESGTTGSGGDFSGTNVQVEGIDEGDVVKTDGEYIYVLSDYELIIVKADGAASSVISRTEVGEHYSTEETENADGSFSYSGSEKSPSEMFISGDRLMLISNASSYSEYKSAEGDWNYESTQCTNVDFFDVSDPSSPVLVTSLGQDGRVIGTRLHEGRLYVVSSHSVWDAGEEESPEDYIPGLYIDGEYTLIAPADICICPYGESTNYIIAAAYEPETAASLGAQSVLGAGSSVYMRGDNIYVTGTVYDDGEGESREESIYKVVDYHHSANTAVHRFSVAEGLSLEAQGLVPGYIESRFSIDEYEGYARLVTTRDEYSYSIYTDGERGFVNYDWHDDELRTNALYILNDALEVVGSVENLAEGESVYSARFDGDIAYFCTFEQVDPLFAVDVSDPTTPVVLSELKISGFSEYLHSWSEGRLFGFGYEADEETGWTESLKMVMFDTTNKADVGVAASHVLEDCWYSEALYDHHAFFIAPEKNIIGFLGDGDYYIYGYDEEGGFYRRGYFSFDNWEYNVRGMYIGEDIYIVGSHSIHILELDTCTIKATIAI